MPLFAGHYREVIQATLKYLSLLRSSKFQRFYQTELATISSTRFRFAEKRHPEEYATWVAEHMAWPVPKEYLLSGPQLTWDWEDHSEEGGCEDKVREYLESFRLSGGRVVLMAKPEEHAKLFPDAQWDKEPWYGTDYRVEKFDDDFIKKVGNFCLSGNRWNDGTNDVLLVSVRAKMIFLSYSSLAPTSSYQRTLMLRSGRLQRLGRLCCIIVICFDKFLCRF